MGGGLVALPRREPSFPSAASRSRKSCHSSASDSLLLELLAINIGSLALLSEGVEGVRRNGEEGMRSPKVDAAPGRARPACSRCSRVRVSDYGVMRLVSRHTLCPAQQRGNELQCLELLWITPIQTKEVEEIVCDDLLVDVVFWSALLQNA